MTTTTTSHCGRRPRRTSTAPASGRSRSAGSAVALDGFDLVVIGAVIPTLSQTGDLGFTDASLTTASTVGLVGVGIGAVLIGPLTDRFGRRRSRDRLRDLVLAAHPGGGVRGQRRDVHHAAVPGRPRPRRRAADRAGLHERGRPAGPQRHRGDPGDDRLPRRRRADRAARALADRRGELAGDVRGRRRRRAARRTGACGRSCPSRRPTCAASRTATRTPPRWRRGPARCSAAATCRSRSGSAWRRSWGCCWSTASTPGCRRSWARPATPSRPAPGCCSCSTSAR